MTTGRNSAGLTVADLELMLTALQSDNPTVQSALSRLRVAVRLAHGDAPLLAPANAFVNAPKVQPTVHPVEHAAARLKDYLTHAQLLSEIAFEAHEAEQIGTIRAHVANLLEVVIWAARNIEQAFRDRQEMS